MKLKQCLDENFNLVDKFERCHLKNRAWFNYKFLKQSIGLVKISDPLSVYLNFEDLENDEKYQITHTNSNGPGDLRLYIF